MTSVEHTRTRPDARAPWQRVARSLLRDHAHLAAWFWGILAVVFVVGHLVASALTGEHVSLTQFGVPSSVWFSFAVAITLFVTQLPLHLAAGRTRKAYIAGSLAAVPLVAALHGLVYAAFVLVEWAVFRAGGWDHHAEGLRQVAGAGLGLFLYLVAVVVSGLLVAATYYRFGGWLGTVALPVTISPLLLAPAALGPDVTPALSIRVGTDPLSITGQSFVPSLGGAITDGPLLPLIAVALAITLFYLAVRRVPIWPARI